VRGAWSFGPPKTRASNRTIPLPRIVVSALAAHLATYPPGPDGLIFTGRDGTPVRRSWLSAKVWQPAVAQAKITSEPTFHDLRHF
jgi:integrase